MAKHRCARAVTSKRNILFASRLPREVLYEKLFCNCSPHQRMTFDVCAHQSLPWWTHDLSRCARNFSFVHPTRTHAIYEMARVVTLFFYPLQNTLPG